MHSHCSFNFPAFPRLHFDVGGVLLQGCITFLCNAKYCGNVVNKCEANDFCAFTNLADSLSGSPFSGCPTQTDRICILYKQAV